MPRKYPTADWRDLLDTINDVVERSEDMQDEAKVKQLKLSLSPETGDTSDSSSAALTGKSSTSLTPAQQLFNSVSVEVSTTEPSTTAPSVSFVNPSSSVSGQLQSQSMHTQSMSLTAQGGFNSPVPPSIPSSLSMHNPGASMLTPSSDGGFNQPVPPSIPSSLSMYSPGAAMFTPSSYGLPNQPVAQSIPSSLSMYNPGAAMFIPNSSYGGNTYPPITSAPFVNPSSPVMSAAPAPHYQYPRNPDIRVKRVELPKFSGDRADWLEFKVIWPRLALPSAGGCKITLAKQLRDSMVGKNVKAKLANIAIIGPQSFDEMWNRLCLYYDDAAASTDSALKKLKSLKPVRDDDYRGFDRLVEDIESAVSQLSNWDQVNCLTMVNVDETTKLLPIAVKTEWQRRYYRLSQAEKLHPFPVFMSFLNQERSVFSRLAEQQSTDANNNRKSYSHAQSTSVGSSSKKGNSLSQSGESNTPRIKYYKCAVHKNEKGKHSTEQCRDFQALPHLKKLDALRGVGACFRCFRDHRRAACKENKPCLKCDLLNHHTLLCRKDKEEETEADVPHSKSNSGSTVTVTDSNQNATKKSLGLYAISTVPVKSSRRSASIFFDNGSDSSYIVNHAAKRLGARKLQKFVLEVTTTGGQETVYESQQYEVDLITKSGKIHTVKLYGIDKITGNVAKLDLNVLCQLFPDYDCSILQRHSQSVDILLGSDVFGLHPKREICSAGQHLSIMDGEFGVCLQGSHPDLQEKSTMDSNMVRVLRTVSPVVSVNTYLTVTSTVKHPIFSQPPKSVKCPNPQPAGSHLTQSEGRSIQKYIEGEELPIKINPKCGGCRCNTCPQPGHTYSFEEEVQLSMIQNNLKYEKDKQHWKTSYPWKQDPSTLPENKFAVLKCLERLEKKLQKDENLARIYQEQMQDMLERGVAREVLQEEINTYKGPVYYISHLGVPNPKSKSTPHRIVFNSSQQYKGRSLNDALYKGPDAYLNSQLGILLRWREELIAIAGDIKKMYNSVHLEEVEQHTHRFLWTNLNYGSTPKTYIMLRVNMGDRPAGAIATEALYKTADMFQSDMPRASELLKGNSYVDDLMDSVPSIKEAKELTEGAEHMMSKGGFIIKFWLFSGDHVEESNGTVTVLGVFWKPESDQICFQASLNFSPKKHGVHILPDLRVDQVPASIPDKLTKRMVLAQVMRIYDPLGLLSPFTVYGRLLLRSTWELKVQWDDPIPLELHRKWVKFFISLYDVNQLQCDRVLKPENATKELPELVLFSDASEVAYGFAAYVRWQCTDDIYRSRLVMAKSRVAPLRKRSIPQLELNAALLSTRGRAVITKEMRYSFSRITHLIDTETVLAMLHKLSTRFPLYEGVRVGEIQDYTDGDISCWAWLPGSKNIADWLTRGKDPGELGKTSEWFCAPAFMSKPMDQWELKFTPTSTASLLDEKHTLHSNATNSATIPPEKFNYSKFSKYPRLLNTVARVVNVIEKRSLKGVKTSLLTPTLLEKAEQFLVKDVQRSIHDEGGEGKPAKTYRNLRPSLVDGIWVVGTRLHSNPLVPENAPQMLLPTKHPVTTLLMEQAHRQTIHGGREATLARFREKFWIPNGAIIAAAVKRSCLLCKIRDPKLLSQKMGHLPVQRSLPSPAFTYTMVDYFGPYGVRGEVQKRITGKAWGVIFTCLTSRAVFIEAVYDYGTDAFMAALTKFASVRGYPSIMFSDPGSNLECASKELQNQWELMWSESAETITSTSAEKGLEWKFSPPDSPWRNGAVESMVKICKKAIRFSMNEQRLSPSEFSCVLYEVANLMNERPLGTIPGSDSEISILTPNSLLMGRSTARNPGGWQPSTGQLERYRLIQQIVKCFWSQWIKTVAPSLIRDPKWQNERENLKPGDVVLIFEDSPIKGDYRLARVKEVYPDAKGLVRKALVTYATYKIGEKTGGAYTGSTKQEVIRSVQTLCLLHSVD